MAAGKFDLAKKYIIYRYTRELVRKANTTDDSIMSLLQTATKMLWRKIQIKMHMWQVPSAI